MENNSYYGKERVRVKKIINDGISSNVSRFEYSLFLNSKCYCYFKYYIGYMFVIIYLSIIFIWIRFRL